MSTFRSRKRASSGLSPKLWALVIGVNVLISAGVGAGTYYWMMSRISSDIAAEDMADDEKMDEEEIPDSDNATEPASSPHTSATPDSSSTPTRVAGKSGGKAAIMTECDDAAADPDDPNRFGDEHDNKVEGVPGNRLDIKRTLAKCQAIESKITASLPIEQLRMQYQRSRAYLQSGRYEDAYRSFADLCLNANYGAACYRLADASRKGIGGLTQDDNLAYKYAEMAANANVAAAGDLMQELSATINPWNRVQARGLMEPLLKGTFDAIPDTVSVRRYFYTLFTQSEKQNGQWYTNLMSNQDHMHATQAIWPILETRLKLSVDEGKQVYNNVLQHASASDSWGTTFSTAVNGVIAARTLLQNANSIQVAVGAQDAQKMFEWFNGCGSCNTRETFVRNLGTLMERWSTSKPAPDDGKQVCALLFRDKRPNCLPLADFEGVNGGNAMDIIKKPGAH